MHAWRLRGRATDVALRLLGVRVSGKQCRRTIALHQYLQAQSWGAWTASNWLQSVEAGPTRSTFRTGIVDPCRFLSILSRVRFDPQSLPLSSSIEPSLKNTTITFHASTRATMNRCFMQVSFRIPFGHRARMIGVSRYEMCHPAITTGTIVLCFRPRFLGPSGSPNDPIAVSLGPDLVSALNSRATRGHSFFYAVHPAFWGWII